MKVKMLVTLSGTKDGAEWPQRGAVVDVSAAEAANLVASGLASNLDAKDAPDVEAAVIDTPVETATKRTTPRRRKG